MNNEIFVDSIHGYGAQGIEKRDNIIKTVLLSNTQIKNWISNGGEENKIVCIPPLIEFPKKPFISLRKQLNIDEDVFIYGMHQGNREDIFSDIPLQAYKQIENKKTLFLMLGGAQKYRNQAQQLNIKNIKFLDFNGDSKYINDFVYTLDVFSHGRFDGEVCSAAIIEALYHGKPIISHPAINNGHFEQIDGCGFIAHSIDEYSKKMQLFFDNKHIYDILSMNSLLKYNNVYSFEKSIDKYINLYKEIVYERNI
jgi:glycosyltransferase involved in cell wall biosynthesis